MSSAYSRGSKSNPSPNFFANLPIMRSLNESMESNRISQFG
jgi:hypothetical protein